MRKKGDFLYIWLLQRSTLYQRRQKSYLQTELHFQTPCMYQQPRLTQQWNYDILVQNIYRYLRYIDRLFDEFFLLLTKNQEEKIELQTKYIEELVCGTSLFSLHILLLMSLFIAFFVYSLPFVHSFDFEQVNINWWQIYDATTYNTQEGSHCRNKDLVMSKMLCVRQRDTEIYTYGNGV